MPIFRTLQAGIQSFLFAPISAKGFSLMRIAWSVQLLITFGFQWYYYDLYFSLEGVWGTMDCSTLTCTILHYICSEPWIHVVFFTLITSLLLTLLGVKPRFFIFVALVIVSLLHSRNWLILNGGDRIEKVIGFMLLLAPNMHMYSLKKPKTNLNAVWIQRLLLWQLIVLYGMAGLRKLEVSGWTNGNKIGLSLHLEQFMRLPPEWFNFLQAWYIPASFFTFGIQIMWLLLLIPKKLRAQFAWRHWPLTLKQTILIGTALMHLGILALMEIDMFAVTMLIGYLGLLNDEDFAALKRLRSKCKQIATRLKHAIISLEKNGRLTYTTANETV